ncbi:hypothetical protein niasHT_000963 [Heterodera trifolii]|uniref:Peptidase M3A/M3B catalytic domain-containing protein n=1 Tax=Heterodera trifolii TaxID=157864 RepID=A0ABD2MD34_9BILA
MQHRQSAPGVVHRQPVHQSGRNKTPGKEWSVQNDQIERNRTDQKLLVLLTALTSGPGPNRAGLSGKFSPPVLRTAALKLPQRERWDAKTVQRICEGNLCKRAAERGQPTDGKKVDKFFICFVPYSFKFHRITNSVSGGRFTVHTEILFGCLIWTDLCVRCMHTAPQSGEKRRRKRCVLLSTSLVENAQHKTTPMINCAETVVGARAIGRGTAKGTVSDFWLAERVSSSPGISIGLLLVYNFVDVCERPVIATQLRRAEPIRSAATSHLTGPMDPTGRQKAPMVSGYRKIFCKHKRNSRVKESSGKTLKTFLTPLWSVSARHNLRTARTNFQSLRPSGAKQLFALGTYENVYSCSRFLSSNSNAIPPLLPCPSSAPSVAPSICPLFSTDSNRSSLRCTNCVLSVVSRPRANVGLENVVKLNVHQIADKAFLGSVFLDIDARQSKVQGDCHFTIRCSKLLDNGQFQSPIVVLSLAIVPDAEIDAQKSSLAVFERATMTVQQAENFFHEMGHAMHSILGRTRFQHVAGTRCPTDFAEVPSNLMECFFNDPRVLQKIWRDSSGRAPTDEKAELLEGIANSRRVFDALHTTRQALYALFDLELHGERAAEIAEGRMSTTELFGHLQRKALPGLKNGDQIAYHHRIAHLFTYGAKYYSYLVARAGASLIYERLFADEPLSGRNGLKWAKVQSHGGEHPSDVLLAMALDSPEGKAPTAAELVAALDRHSSAENAM